MDSRLQYMRLWNDLADIQASAWSILAREQTTVQRSGRLGRASASAALRTNAGCGTTSSTRHCLRGLRSAPDPSTIDRPTQSDELLPHDRHRWPSLCLRPARDSPVPPQRARDHRPPPPTPRGRPTAVPRTRLPPPPPRLSTPPHRCPPSPSASPPATGAVRSGPRR
jgi:hypothetical protein